MASIPAGGTYKPKRKTYRAILKSDMAHNLCMRAARSIGGPGRKMRAYQQNGRQKARVYDKDEHLKHVRPTL